MKHAREAESVSFYLCDNPDCCNVHVDLHDGRGKVFARAVVDTSDRGLLEHFVSYWQEGEAKRATRLAHSPSLPH
jgi:hypothetical protein